MLSQAATVMLVRDAAAGGIEVFLMKRSMAGVFGGLHVFPGGKVDASDDATGFEAIGTGLHDPEASSRLGLERGGLAYWVACIRECFEEAGVLLARRADGKTLPLRDPAVRERFTQWRARLNAGEAGVMTEMCEAEGLTLAYDELAYVAHWITPKDQPRRFNTRFFVARAPEHQEALHDGHETVESEWLRPEDALSRFHADELNLISPTIRNLEDLRGFADTASALAAKHAIDPATIPVIRPEFVASPKGGDSEHLTVIGHGGKFEDPV